MRHLCEGKGDQAMRRQNETGTVMEAIDYMEEHLSEKLYLEQIAEAVHYSKYHLHRMFVREAGLTVHDYAQRRRLTEAARLLAFSDRPIMEIALSAGYESRQAFTTIFRQMYKKTPNQFREERIYYPLQLRFKFNRDDVKSEDMSFWKRQITFATLEDISQWMSLVYLVIDGFPYLHEAQYLVQLREAIVHHRALILRDGGTVIGIMTFVEESGKIDFLGVHPRYRRQGIAGAFLGKLREELVSADLDIMVTTFREGDKADTGYRNMFKALGFSEAELLVEFGYPTQRFILRKEDRGTD